ncbi:MAG TPA: hypothetical protein VGK32_05880 [Vicinamibacterales bacterium]|jgi:hypothetical protein
MADTTRVLVGMPTRGFPWIQSIIYAQQLATELGTGLALQVGQPVHVVRNRMVRNFLKSGCTHFFMIHDDVVPPPGALAKLLAIDRPVATGVYPLSRTGRPVSSVMGIHDETWPDRCPQSTFPVKHCGLGCVLVRREAFEKIGFPWFYWQEDADGGDVGEDVWFCQRVRRAGLQIYCDGTLVCSHVKSNFDLATVWPTVQPESSPGT